MTNPNIRTRAKFKVMNIHEFEGYKNVSFSAVIDDGIPENQTFHKYTPSGTINITVNNPAVTFAIGESFYLDFVEAGPPVDPPDFKADTEFN